MAENPEVGADRHDGSRGYDRGTGSATGAAHWHDMLRGLVDAKGGEAAVALAYCKVTRRKSATSFETARRNLSNWITGASLPRRQNFLALTRALDIREATDAMERWTGLYDRARAKAGAQQPAGATTGLAGTLPAPAETTRMPRLDRALTVRHAAWGSLALLVAATAWMAVPNAASGDDERTIGYLPFAELRVGETVLVHAKRGACGQPAPEWREFAHEIPALATGRLIDDGEGTSRSTTCGGTTPGRLVRFVAEKPGDETFDLFQRKIHVIVTP